LTNDDRLVVGVVSTHRYHGKGIGLARQDTSEVLEVLGGKVEL